jgi:hypothetical protein
MNKAKEAKKHLDKIRRIIAKNPSPIFKMTKEEVIKTLRRTRESIWKEKIALRH